MKFKLIAGALALIVLVLLVLLINRGGDSSHRHQTASAPGETTSVYSCPMHPQIRQPEFGQCPLCGMDLVPIASDADGDEDSELPILKLNRRAAALMEIQTAPVERRSVQAERRFLGMFGYDETRLHDLSVRTEGQLERLFVNYTGVPVRKGEHIAEIYSPEFYAAARDLLVARSAVNDPVALDGARRKLHLLNVTDAQIDAILESGQPAEHFTLYSPVAGVITQLDGRQGSWLMKGQRIAQIADISSLWVLLDAYESDIALIHYGQQVQLEVPAFPGRPVTGFVAYVAPDLDERTRTIKVRLNVPNADGRLRPGMFAHALLKVPLTAAGEAYGPELAGKYICPMHPEITGPGPEPCSICGMPLEPAATLDPIHTHAQVTLPLVIPDTAPLITGKRAIVYLQLPNHDRPTFEGRTVTLGPRAGDHYLVLDGLEEGDRVVTHGNFKIDSELQIRGRPSMMSPPERAHTSTPSRPESTPTTDTQTPPGPIDGVPTLFGQAIAPVVRDYLKLVDRLAADDFPEASAAVTAMDERLRAVDTSSLSAETAETWKPVAAGLLETLAAMRSAGEIVILRQQLVPLTRHMEHAAAGFGAGQLQPLFKAHCPMAFNNRGADWLQADEEIANPYFGSKMFRCGEITGMIP
jgi:membrane fusion protein, copper/silver efflux system